MKLGKAEKGKQKMGTHRWNAANVAELRFRIPEGKGEKMKLGKAEKGKQKWGAPFESANVAELHFRISASRHFLNFPSMPSLAGR